ncbi:MAG: YifB family Mg chelatase-like AAA ATPase [Luminiphilus sp.]|nr:YifB family Mg chelatase-like AAA ATPase [Luminiphilus sp.]
MRFARVASRAQLGLDAPPIWVEVHLTPGLPAVNVVGMAESTVREAKERVRSAIISSGFKWPDSRITINLSPAELPKVGARFDLAIAVGLLAASGQIKPDAVDGKEFYGELGLDGRLLGCKGLLSAVVAATQEEQPIVLPEATVQTLPYVSGSQLHPLNTLADLSKTALPTVTITATNRQSGEFGGENRPANSEQLSDQLMAQPMMTRTLAIAAAGGHHLLLSGEPGTGKTLSASTLPLLLPALTDDERLQIQIIRDIAGLAPTDKRPFRAPHHSASLAGLIGGTSRALPGEITLAHCGVLFLDELPEFKREVLETLRQPLESGEVTVARAGITHSYPACFQLIAAMNPCPCGYLTSTTTNCRCSATAIQRYQSRLSGPLMDRFDLHATVNRIDTVLILKRRGAQVDIHALQQETAQARRRQLQRQGVLNTELSSNALEKVCQLDDGDVDWLAKAANGLKLSARTVHRSMRVARTIADLSGETRVSRQALAEALSFRPASHSGT